MRAMSTSWMVSGTAISASSRASTTVPVLAPQRAVLEERARHLLDEERVALGLRGDQVAQRLGGTAAVPSSEPVIVRHLGRRERPQRHAHVVAAVAERCR